MSRTTGTRNSHTPAPKPGDHSPRMSHSTKPSSKRSRNPIGKALSALDFLIRSPDEVGVRQIANALKLQPSNAHQVLLSLVELGFVSQNQENARYRAGPELLRWAHAITRKSLLTRAAEKHVSALAKTCNEAVLLGVYDASREQMMFMLSAEPDHPLRYAVAMNEWIPLNTGASSLAILAFLPQSEVTPILRRIIRRAPLTPNSLSNLESLQSELERVRSQGYALSQSQRLAGAVGIAAPIFGPGGQVVGDLVFTLPEQRFQTRHLSRFVSELTRHALDITQEIGGSRNSNERAASKV